MCLKLKLERIGDGGSRNDEGAAQSAGEELHAVWPVYTRMEARMSNNIQKSRTLIRKLPLSEQQYILGTYTMTWLNLVRFEVQHLVIFEGIDVRQNTYPLEIGHKQTSYCFCQNICYKNSCHVLLDAIQPEAVAL